MDILKDKPSTFVQMQIREHRMQVLFVNGTSEEQLERLMIEGKVTISDTTIKRNIGHILGAGETVAKVKKFESIDHQPTEWLPLKLKNVVSPLLQVQPTAQERPLVTARPTDSGQPAVLSQPADSGQPTVLSQPTGSGQPAVKKIPTLIAKQKSDSPITEIATTGQSCLFQTVNQLICTANQLANKEKFAQANLLIQAGQALLDENGGRQSELGARLLLCQADQHRAQRQFKEAIRIASSAHQTAMKALGQNHPFTLECLGSYAYMQLLSGDRSGIVNLSEAICALNLAANIDHSEVYAGYNHDRLQSIQTNFTELLMHADSIIDLAITDAASRVCG